VRSTLLQSEAELLELLGRLGQLEFTVDAIRVSRDESETAMQLDELFFVRLFISLESLI
jgi:hypothetical protein